MVLCLSVVKALLSQVEFKLSLIGEQQIESSGVKTKVIPVKK